MKDDIITCEYCHNQPHLDGCPNKSEKIHNEIIQYCLNCSTPIYKGNDFCIGGLGREPNIFCCKDCACEYYEIEEVRNVN